MAKTYLVYPSRNLLNQECDGYHLISENDKTIVESFADALKIYPSRQIFVGELVYDEVTDSHLPISAFGQAHYTKNGTIIYRNADGKLTGLDHKL